MMVFVMMIMMVVVTMGTLSVMIKWLLLFLVLQVLSELLSVFINSNPEQLWWWTEWKKWDCGARAIVFFFVLFF